MNKSFVAQASIDINASVATVWDALINPEMIKQYMFGTDAISDWKEGSPIVWKGEWEGKMYEDKGTILKMDPERMIQYTHYSPLSSDPDVPENYHTLTIELSGNEENTAVTLSQDNNETEEAREHAEKNWQMMLEGLKKLLEE